MGSMSKDALEGMATILRENGYEVTEKNSDIAIGKLPYKWYCFNRIENIDLEDIDGFTCIFLTEQGYEDLKADLDIGAVDICTGYIRYYEDADENLVIHTGYNDKLRLDAFKYVTRVMDIIASLEDKEKYFA